MIEHEDVTCHVVVSLDTPHVDAVRHLSQRMLDAVRLPQDQAPRHPHITLVAYQRLDLSAAIDVLRPVVAAIAPFWVRAHGFGIFCGHEPGGLSLHVPVVRSDALNHLHAQLHAALANGGASMAGHTAPDVWTPHVNLIDANLDSARLGAAVSLLTQRPHPHWNVPVERLRVLGDRAATDAEDESLVLGARAVG